jgi:3-hydroxyisobutyrate dehydrogenase
MMSVGDPVALLGAGSTMGLPMARHIARSGAELRAWNRTREKAEPLAGNGARVCGTPAEAAEEAAVILTMLADADAVVSCAREALPAARKDAIWLQMSTIGEQGTDQCLELARAHGISFFDAPVLGTKQPAEEGKLVILASGPASCGIAFSRSSTPWGRRRSGSVKRVPARG